MPTAAAADDDFRYRSSRVVVDVIDRAKSSGMSEKDILDELEVTAAAVVHWRKADMSVRAPTARRARRLDRRLAARTRKARS
jgi:hypothetical protein